RWLGPIFGLGRTMERFAGGDRDARARIEGPEEIRDMARRFNGLANTISRQHEAQVAFLAGAVHDLRNPLTALKLAAGAAERRDTTDPRRLLGVASRQVDNLDRMLTDLLETARVHAGQLALDLQEHDVRDLVRDVADLFSVSVTHKVLTDL